MESPIQHIEYPATLALHDPIALQAWLDTHRGNVVATEKIDGSNTVFWLTKGAGHVVVALFSRANVVYVAHVSDSASTDGKPTTGVEVVFQADLKRFPVPMGQILQISAREPLLQRLAAVFRSFTRERPDCTEIMVCGETTHPKISKKIAYGNQATFRVFGLQFRLRTADVDEEGAAWYWDAWDAGRRGVVDAGLEHVAEVELVGEAPSAEELRRLVDTRISSYVSLDADGERRAEGIVFRTRAEVEVEQCQLIKIVRGTYGDVPTPAPKGVSLQAFFKSIPLEGLIKHSNGHGFFFVPPTEGEVDAEALKALAADVHKEVLQRATASGVPFNEKQADGFLKSVTHALNTHYRLHVANK